MGALQKVTESSAPALRGPYTIADYIVARMKAEGLSQRTVAKNTGYDRCRINRILREENRLPISIVEAEAILASMGAGALEVALANDMITNNEPVSAEDMAAVVALIAVVVQGLPMKVASLLEVVSGLQSEDIRKEHGVRIHNAIFEMLKDLYTDLIGRKDDRLDHTKY